MVVIILLVVGAVFFALAALGLFGKHLIAAGLFCWILIDLLKTAGWV